MTQLSAPRHRSRPKPDVLRGVLVLGLTAALGWFVASTQLFGPATPGRSSPEINGLLIAVAPLIAAFVAYRPVRKEMWAPRGLATSPEVGSPVLFCAWLLTAFPVSILFAWGSSRSGEALTFWLLVNLTWILTLEIQRRTRDLAPALVGGREYSLRLNYEGLAAGALWAVVALAAGEPRLACFAIAVGVTLTYLSAALRLSQLGVTRALFAWPMLIGGFGVGGYAPVLISCLALLIAALSIPAIVEKPRRVFRVPPSY